MTMAALIESLKPGELVIRCADGTLMRTMSSGYRANEERRPASMRKLMRSLTALKQGKKR